jgi:WD40-like Beta Propeller Repeat
VVLRDITNTSAAQTLCTFTGAIAPHFDAAAVVAYNEGGQSIGDPGDIKRLDLIYMTAAAVASWSNAGFDSGIFDWSPDSTMLTYIGGSSPGPTWHLLSGGTDHVLATLPPVPGRGVSMQNDDFMVAFSPDGLYLALETTFATGGSGETAPIQVRRVSDGTLVYSATSGTFAVWASIPSRLFFRDATGGITRWDPSSGAGQMLPALAWTRPHASPDGRWIAYTTYDSGSLPHVGLYSVQGNSLGPQPAGLRSGALFLNNNLLWYQEEASTGCGLGGCSTLTGNAFIYDIARGAEVASRITDVFDVWPRVAAPPSLG